METQPGKKPQSPAWLPWVLVALCLGGAAAIWRYQTREDSAARANIETKLTPTSTVDATADVVDEDFRFKIKWPGKGYQVLHEEEAKRIAASSRAVIVGENGCFLTVIADYWPGVGLPELADMLLATLPANGRREISRSAVTIGGRDGIAIEAEASPIGKRQSYWAFATSEDGWMRAVVRWNGLNGSTCDALSSSVSFLDGKVKGRPLSVERQTDVHRMYSIRDGLYVNPSDRLRVEAPPNTIVLAGADAFRRAGMAVAIVGQGLEAQLASLEGTETPLRDRLAYLMEKGQMPLPAQASFTRSIGGAETPFYEVDPPTPAKSLVGAAKVGSRELYFIVHYAPALRVEAEAFLDAVLAGTTVMDDAAAATAQEALPTIDPARIIESDRSIRGERFVDYANGIRLAPPSHPALMLLGGLVVTAMDARLSILRPDSVFTVVLARDAAPHLEDEQLDVAGDVVLVELVRKDATFSARSDGSKRMRATYDLGVGGTGTVQVDTFEQGGALSLGARWIHVVTWGETPAFEAQSEATDALAAGVTVDKGPIQMSTTRGSHIEDRRLGFAMDLPGDGWTIHPPSDSTPLSTLYEAVSERGRVQVVCTYVNRSDDLFEGWIEQSIARAGLADLGVPTRSTGILGGLAGRRLEWKGKAEAVLVRDGVALFGIAVESRGTPGLDAAEVYRGFRLLQ